MRTLIRFIRDLRDRLRQFDTIDAALGGATFRRTSREEAILEIAHGTRPAGEVVDVAEGLVIDSAEEIEEMMVQMLIPDPAELREPWQNLNDLHGGTWRLRLLAVPVWERIE